MCGRQRGGFNRWPGVTFGAFIYLGQTVEVRRKSYSKLVKTFKKRITRHGNAIKNDRSRKVFWWKPGGRKLTGEGGERG